MRKPNLKSLKMFDAAARHLNFRHAAEELKLTQGAVAQQVRQLESDLEIQLFNRSARGLAFTEIGRKYHTSISQALAIIDDATRKLRSKPTHITLSVTTSFASKWLVPRLAAFSRAHPNIEVQIIASEGFANFQSDGVDLAIRKGHPPFGENLNTEYFSPIDLRAVCSPGYAEEVAPIKQIEDFTVLQLLQDSFNLWDRLFEEAGLRAQHRMMKFNQTSLAMDAAANRQGVALAPRILLDHELEQGRLVEIWQDDRKNQDGYYIVYPRNSKSNPARDALIEWALSDVGNIKTE